MKRSVALVVGLLCLSVAAYAGPIMVLFDEAHDELNTISWERALEVNSDHPEFQYFGKLNELPPSEFRVERGLKIIDALRLQGFDIVVIASPMATFSDEEINVLGDFVDHGGGLLVVQDAWPDPLGGGNQLAESFGLRYRAGALCSEHSDWDAGSFRASMTRSSCSIVQGIDEFQMNWGSSIKATNEDDVLFQTDEYAWQDVNGNRRRDAEEPQGPLIVAIARQVNEGRIVFIADNAFHDNIWYANGQLFRNALEWLASTVQQSVALDVPSFDVDPDVTLDSVVQVGDGPQELSAQIKFYPNTRRIMPGETVYWTLDLGTLQGSFTVIHELDNDAMRETEIKTDDSKIVVSFTYETAGIYVPYVLVRDGVGTTRKIFTKNVLGVIPELQQRQRIGLKVPTVEDPIGDIVKGMQVMGLDENRFLTPDGEEGIKAEISRWADAGVNFVMYNVPLYVSDIHDSVTYPHYGEAAPTPWSSTWHLDSISRLTDWAHAAGIRVAIRPFMMTAGDEGDEEGTARFRYQPTDLGLYFDYHVQIKSILAEVAETIGVEMFNIDAENPVTSMHDETLLVLDAVRSVFSGVVSDTACVDNGTLALSPLHDQVDVIYVSLGPHHTDLGEAPLAQFEGSYYTQMTNEVLPILYDKRKAGMLETFASPVPLNGEVHQARSYEAILWFLHTHPSLLMGTTYWETSLGYISAFDPFGHPAEAILTTYFGAVMPDSRRYSFESPFRIPRVMRVLSSFETSASQVGLVVYYEDQGNLALSRTVAEVHEGSRALSAVFTSSASTNRGTYIAGVPFVTPQDWSAYSSFNIWVRTDGTLGGLWFELLDADGDRFTSSGIAAPPAESGWTLMSVRLQDYVQPTWCPRGDGKLDLRKIVRWSIGRNRWSYEASTSFQTWFDLAYLGGPMEEACESADSLETASGDGPVDSDGDGVPDDEDYCPDWPGSHEKNGC